VSTPQILALDFDGVLCEGTREYFESSRRTYRRTWPEASAPGDDHLSAFRTFRPVIETGWEMPLLLRAIVLGEPDTAIQADWPGVRDRLIADGNVRGEALVEALTRTLDEVRRQWIAAQPTDWVAHHAPYCALDEVRRVVDEPSRTVIVTTKEGEFTQRILDAWKVGVAGVQGKEAGHHKCDNLRALIAGWSGELGARPTLWFVEDRLETLEHVTTHADLDDVGLFLAAWGYNTAETQARLHPGGRIRLLTLDHFRRGITAWPHR
jgi:hypothetical protein